MEYYKTKYEELVKRLKTEKETAPIIASLISSEAPPVDTRKAESTKTEQESLPPANTTKSIAETAREIKVSETSDPVVGIVHVEALSGKESREVKVESKAMGDPERLKGEGNDAFKAGRYKESLVKYTKATQLTDGDNNKRNIEPHLHHLHDKVQAKTHEMSTTIAESVVAISPEPKKMEAGQILITVFKARNIEKKARFGKVGPYVRISLGRQEAKSPTIKNNHEPEWNFKANFDIDESTTDGIKIVQ